MKNHSETSNRISALQEYQKRFESVRGTAPNEMTLIVRAFKNGELGSGDAFDLWLDALEYETEEAFWGLARDDFVRRVMARFSKVVDKVMAHKPKR